MTQSIPSPYRLGGIEYRVADSATDYRMCHQLATAEAVVWTTYKFPTVMAKHNGRLIGFMSTGVQGELILGGPLVIESGNQHPMVALRLIEAYDSVMSGLGIEWYVFGCIVDSPMARFAEKLGMLEYARKDGQVYFLREFITDGTSEGRSAEAEQGGEPFAWTAEQTAGDAGEDNEAEL